MPGSLQRGPRRARTLLDVRATSFSASPRLDPGLFRVPKRGLVKDGAFSPRPWDRLAVDAPAYVAGLERYRAGLTSGRAILSFSDGMTWLKVTADPGSHLATDATRTAEQVMLPGGRFAYYEPAVESSPTEASKRRVDVYGARRRIHLESNLGRDALLRVAASLDVRGRRLPALSHEGGLTVERVDPRRATSLRPALAPTYLPAGYRPSAAFLSRSSDGRRTVTLYLRKPEATYDGFGIRITQSRPVRTLPPTSERFRAISAGALRARWSPERGELEWIDHGTLRAVAAPSFGPGVAVRIARGLR